MAFSKTTKLPLFVLANHPSFAYYHPVFFPAPLLGSIAEIGAKTFNCTITMNWELRLSVDANLFSTSGTVPNGALMVLTVPRRAFTS